MISALYWVRKGVAAEIPEKYELDDKEYDRINQIAAIQLEEEEEEYLEKNQKTKNITNDNEIDPELDKYNLDQYDDDEDNEQPTSLFGNMKGLAYYASNEEDPYITIDDEDDEKEDIQILPTDNVLIVAKTEDEVSQLEIYVYEEAENNLYVHHDIMLPSFPLCLEWLDFRLGRKVNTEGSGNYIAVGTFDPEIEIWDLDTIDSMYPDAILGKQEEKQKKKKKSKKPNAEFHTDSVMSLSWNKLHRNLLASSSADTTVKLWDLQSLKCAHSFNHHKDKVQQVEWHPIESTILLTASFDKSIVTFDSRAPTSTAFWNVDADPECIRWDPFSPQHFYVSLENGLVLYFDVRNFGQVTPIFTLHAHDSAVSSLDVSSSIRGCIVTGSTDKFVKVWDVKDMKPNMVTSRNLGVGKVFTTQFCPDSPFQLAVAGSEGKVFIWDLSSNAGIRNSFEGRATIPFSSELTVADKPLVTLTNDESELEGDDDDDDDDDDMEDIEDDSGDDV